MYGKVLPPTQVVTMAELACSHLHHHIYSTQFTSQVSTISQAIKPALSNLLIALIFLYFSCCNCSYPTSLLTLFGVDDHKVLWIICDSEVLHICNTLHSPRCSARIPHRPHGFRGFREDSDLTSKGAHRFRVSPHRFRVSPCGFRASPHRLHGKLASQHPSKFRMNYSAQNPCGFHME
jgi:hypothetical protein